MNNLTLALCNQNKYNMAKKILQQALELKKKVLGPKYKSTLANMRNLMLILICQGKYKIAEKIY